MSQGGREVEGRKVNGKEERGSCLLGRKRGRGSARRKREGEVC